MNETEEFSGVYYFTNPTKQVRKYLWNNKEYVFEPETRSPLIIQNETSEATQEIRKRFAYRMAEERLYEGEKLPSGYEYKKAAAMGNGIPPIFDERILEPLIQECLKPLPLKKATVISLPHDSDRDYKATKAIGENENPNMLFSEENKDIPKLGKMS